MSSEAYDIAPKQHSWRELRKILETTPKGMEKCVTANRTYLEREYVTSYFSDKRMHISSLETKHSVILSQSIQTA